MAESQWKEFFAKYDAIPNRKTDVNNHGPFSYDNIGMNWDYPEASYERRKEIIEEHVRYQKGLLYFTATSKRLPEWVRERMSEWDLHGMSLPITGIGLIIFTSGKPGV